VIAALLPAAVASAQSFVDDGVFLYAEEARHVARAVPARRRQFATVRRCAREALASLGVAPGPLLPGHRGAPIWPPGIAGSMTHCDGYLAAAVARASDVPALGIDAEPNRPLPEAGLLAMIASRFERERVAALALARPDVRWDRLIFSAKESTFKAWFPATGRELEFADVDVAFDASTRTFTATMLAADPGAFEHLTGRWTATPDLLVTAIAPSADAASLHR
jgi:4'-phosphopantetheinyl transferase EntD